MRFPALVALLVFAAIARAAGVEVLRAEPDQNSIVVRQDPMKPYAVGESVCLPPDKGEVRCGKVIRAVQTEATLFLTLRAQGIQVDVKR